MLDHDDLASCLFMPPKRLEEEHEYLVDHRVKISIKHKIKAEFYKETYVSLLDLTT